MCVYIVGDIYGDTYIYTHTNTHTHIHISLHPTIPIESHPWQPESLYKISIIQIYSNIFIFVFFYIYFLTNKLYLYLYSNILKDQYYADHLL